MNVCVMDSPELKELYNSVKDTGESYESIKNLVNVWQLRKFNRNKNFDFTELPTKQDIENLLKERDIPNIDSTFMQEYTQEMKDILANAPRDEQGRLLAPNGKPSNLTERQYAQVRTKAFKEWFGDWENNPETASKVVDENGEPLVVYHGTRTGDAIKKEGFSSKMSGKGNRGADNKQFYFTSSYENAEYTGVKAKEIEPLIDIITSVYDLFGTSDIPSIKDIYKIVESNKQKVRELKNTLYKIKEDSPIKKIVNKLFKLFNIYYALSAIVFILLLFSLLALFYK